MELRFASRKPSLWHSDSTQDCWKGPVCQEEALVGKVIVTLLQGLCFEVEELTGGLVIWISGSKLLVYRDQEFNDLRKEWQAVDKKKRRIQSETSKHIR